MELLLEQALDLAPVAPAVLQVLGVRLGKQHDDLCGNQIYGAFVLHRRVDLHAIDATSARWRGGVNSSPLDGTSMATDALVDFHTDHYL